MMDKTTVKLTSEAELSAGEKQLLRNRLDAFYNGVTDYTDFGKVNNKTLYWNPIGEEVIKIRAHNQLVRVLEIGAGRSGFCEFLLDRHLRQNVYYTAQDVTNQNADWLRSQADCLVLGDIDTISDKENFDIIFSTFVFEHVTDPDAHLNTILRLLKRKGSLFIFCPRFDVPGYLCPSSRHLGLVKRLELSMQWGWGRLKALIRRRPAFLIQTDLAAFHMPFFRDSDAVHWASQLDLKLWARQHRLRFQRIQLVSFYETGFKNWIIKRWLTCAVQMQKN